MVRMSQHRTIALASHACEHDVFAAHAGTLQEQEHNSRLCHID